LLSQCNLCRYVEVLQWLFNEGHKWCEYTWAAVSRAAARGGGLYEFWNPVDP
jgi:hypothetical protein